jgi:predicted nucleic acid-binding Zn ribbon protein
MEAIAGILSRVLRRYGLEDELKGWQAVEEWAAVVGARIAKHTTAVGFREGVLRVEVEGSAWMQELGFLQRKLIQKINRHLGRDTVREIRFIIPRGGSLR